MTDEAVISHLSADRPITSLKEDLLGRGDYAISLASAIQNWKGTDSLVLGLYGPWGHGKTSLKNLVLSLLTGSEQSPAIVEFNPWNWTGEERIQQAFFEEVGLVIGKKATGPNADELASKWKKYATRLTLGGTALGHLRTAAEVAGIPWAPLILGSLSKATESVASVSEQAAQAHSAEAEGLDQTVEALKQELHDALAELERPVLVVMDDIDRLTKEEIRLLFRVIKSNADFPNVIYLLLFEREVIEKALEGVTGSNGREYMEKIVQAGFDLPKVQQEDIDNALTAGLNDLLQYEGIAEGFDSDRWQNFYRDALRPFFQSLRDVRRFLSTFSFELGLFYRNRALDINFIDLIGLEVLRVFEPELHFALANSKELLIRTPYGHLFGRDEKEDVVKTFQTLLESTREGHRSAVERLVAGLFPKIEWALKGYGYGQGFEDGWEQALRVCHHAMFDRYFIMTIPKGEIRLSLLKTILEATNRKELVELLTQLHEQGMLASAIERLEAYKNSLDVSHAREFVTGLLDIDEMIPFDPGLSFGMSTEMSLNRLIHHYVLQEKDKRVRSDLMLECLQNCKGVWLPVRFVALEEPEPSEEDLDRFVFDDDGLKEAKEVCLTKIRGSNLEGIEEQKLLSCLFRWRDWAGQEEPSQWANKQAETVKGCLRLLRACLQTSYVSGGSGTVEKKFIKLGYLEEFVDIELLKSTLGPLLTGEAEAEEAADFEIEIDAFNKALKRREAGEADDWRSDED